jgi:tRNA dimethylallyltransferase
MAAAAALGDIELVSIDSMQVYRGMDIGTAKPTVDEQRRVPHHLIDLVGPETNYAVAEFQQAYRQVMAELAGRRRRAILVGGTGLYHRAVIDDLDVPGEWPEVRSALTAALADVGALAMHARLAAIDPVAATRMEPKNERRVIRALEVCEGSGRPFSSFGPGLEVYPPTDVVQIGLRWDRAVLAGRIEQRVHRMVADGMLAEVAGLSDHGLSRTARQALGYKELLAHLEGSCSLEAAVDRTIVRTRQFAVRQLRWFQRDPRVRWVDVEHDPVDEALPIVLAAFPS